MYLLLNIPPTSWQTNTQTDPDEIITSLVEVCLSVWHYIILILANAQFTQVSMRFYSTRRKHKYERTSRNSPCPHERQRETARGSVVFAWAADSDTTGCFELLILSQISKSPLIPETSWSYCRGIPVVLLINQLKILEDSLADWRTAQRSSVQLLWKHMFLHFSLWHVWLDVPQLWKSNTALILLILNSFKILSLFKDFSQQERRSIRGDLFRSRLSWMFMVKPSRDAEVDFGALDGQSSYFGFWVLVSKSETAAYFQLRSLFENILSH